MLLRVSGSLTAASLALCVWWWTALGGDESSVLSVAPFGLIVFGVPAATSLAFWIIVRRTDQRTAVVAQTHPNVALHQFMADTPAVLALRRKQPEAARVAYEKAWALAERSGSPPAGLAVEYLSMLQETGQAQRGMQVFLGLPEAAKRAERVQILRGQFAIVLGDLDAVEEVLSLEYAGVREGETVLSDLWFELQARKNAIATGRVLDAGLRKEIQRTCPPPARIDFRSFNED